MWSWIARRLLISIPVFLGITMLTFALLRLALAIGVPVGIIAALKQYSAIDYASAILSLTTISTPSFFLGLAAIYIFSLKLDLLPTSGMFTPGAPPSFGDAVKHLI